MTTLKKIKEVLAATPLALEPTCCTDEVNAEVILYAGELSICQGSITETCQGKIFLHWVPIPEIAFLLEGAGHPTKLKFCNNLDVEIPGQTKWPAFFTRWSTQERRGVFCGSLELIYGSSSDPSISYLTFNLPNLDDVLGSLVNRHNELSSERQNCTSSTWNLIIDCTPNSREMNNELKASGGFAFTHTGKMSRSDGRTFRAKDARGVLPKIHVFTSFARGRWTSPMLVEGRNARDEVVWKQWATWKSLPWGHSNSWVPRYEGYASAFDGFMRLADNEQDFESLQAAIHWYVCANNQDGGVDGALIHLQAALELLAWQFLVRKAGILDDDGFGKLTAYNKIRALLTVQRIPIVVPSHIQKIVGTQIRDLVDLIVIVRNGLVHPPKGGKKRPNNDCIAAAWKSALWCVELTILHSLDYRGKFWNRISETLSATSSELVPWAK
jgi:hypothetical protein